MRMHRRTLLQTLGTATVALAAQRAWPQRRTNDGDSSWRTFEITTRIAVQHPAGSTRLWVPVPLASATPFQRSVGTSVTSDGGQWRTVSSPQQGLTVIAATFPAGVTPLLTVRSRVETRDWNVPTTASTDGRQRRAGDLSAWLQPSKNIPVDGIVRDRADRITAGAVSDEAKARAIYEWIVGNTYRRADVRGCGTGDVRAMLESGDLGGKCADLNALFVGLARAAGLPARDVYGIRVAPSRLGYRSLGPHTDVVTKAQHCRAEVWLQRHGWVPVDPADVRKVMLEEAQTELPATDLRVSTVRDRLFGSWEMNWVGFNYAQDVTLPGASSAPLHFLMYPQAETAEGRLDCLDPENFRYTITAREIT